MDEVAENGPAVVLDELREGGFVALAVCHEKRARVRPGSGHLRGLSV
jgi:hypothetical protein